MYRRVSVQIGKAFAPYAEEIRNAVYATAHRSPVVSIERCDVVVQVPFQWTQPYDPADPQDGFSASRVEIVMYEVDPYGTDHEVFNEEFLLGIVRRIGEAHGIPMREPMMSGTLGKL